MNWTAISLTNLTDGSVVGVVASLQAQATAAGQSDPWSRFAQQITDELRDSIGFSGKYVLDADGTKIPAGLLDLAVKKILREMSKSIQRPLSQDERDDEKLYQQRLDQIRLGNWPIKPPDNPLPANTPAVQDSVPVPAIARMRHRRFGRQEGI
jgi:hypothetical protein